MGGDRGPAEIVAGALDARGDGVEPVLFGAAGLDTHGLELRETTEVIGMHEKPAEAVRGKPGSSLVASVRAVARGEADAVLSAGNTGAMLAAGLLELRRLPGVMRPAIAVPIPSKRGPSVLIDAGANADARPEHLLQFATMGAVFAEEIRGLAVIAHGSSSRMAIANAIRLAARGVDHDVVGRLGARLPQRAQAV